MSDETNRAVQAPTQATTAMIYEDDGGMENQASRRSEELKKISLAHRHIKPCEWTQQ